MFDWQDKNSYGKLQKILQKLLDNGFNAKMSNNLKFVLLFNTEGEQVCEAYSSPISAPALVRIQHWTKKIGSTFNADEAYELMIKYYEEKVKKR